MYLLIIKEKNNSLITCIIIPGGRDLKALTLKDKLSNCLCKNPTLYFLMCQV